MVYSNLGQAAAEERAGESSELFSGSAFCANFPFPVAITVCHRHHHHSVSALIWLIIVRVIN